MGLVICQDCRKPYSELATACPNCGRPTEAAVKQAQVIELTSKKYKLANLIGTICTLVGFIGIFASVDHKPHFIVATILGLVIFLYSRLGAWWNNA
jgi:hypothetical protein